MSSAATYLMIFGDMRNELKMDVVFEVKYSDDDGTEGDTNHESFESPSR